MFFDTGLRLYEVLLRPVAAGWQDARNLLVVPHGPLAQLPLSLLVTEPSSLVAERPGEVLFANYKTVSWLARRVTISQLPSVASLASLHSQPPDSVGRKAFAGFGDPYFGLEQAAEAARTEPQALAQLETRATGAEVSARAGVLLRRSAPATQLLDSSDLSDLPRLADTADEVLSIAKALKADVSADVFLGLRANEKVVKTMPLDDRRTIVFATHGLVPGDLDGLMQPALALTSPAVANVAGDGLLTMEEVLGLRLDADWVVLSACNTAAAQGAGAEAISGLGRAFFYAGARALLVSNWPVETTSAKALTTDLFRRQAESPSHSRAEALRQSMLSLIDGPGFVDKSGRTVFSYAHPIFWAPFSLVGDGAGTSAGS